MRGPIARSIFNRCAFYSAALFLLVACAPVVFGGYLPWEGIRNHYWETDHPYELRFVCHDGELVLDRRFRGPFKEVHDDGRNWSVGGASFYQWDRGVRDDFFTDETCTSKGW